MYVVGHTDNIGILEANLKLSADRADAVVKALTGKGIAASRLKASGVGPYSPVASNRTDEGKARNRRVELVEQKSAPKIYRNGEATAVCFPVFL